MNEDISVVSLQGHQNVAEGDGYDLASSQESVVSNAAAARVNGIQPQPPSRCVRVSQIVSLRSSAVND